VAGHQKDISPSKLVPKRNRKLKLQYQQLASTTAALIHLLQSFASLLKTNDFVIVYALDFSKAFYSVRHSTVLSKMSLLDIPDNI